MTKTATKPVTRTGWLVAAEHRSFPAKRVIVGSRSQARLVRASLRRRGFTTHDPKQVTS